MNTLTKKQALELCREQWQMIIENPTRSKNVIYEIVCKKYGLSDIAESSCFCCDYAAQLDPKKSVDCQFCPLLKLWPNNCMEENSAYIKYRRAKTFGLEDNIKKAAQIIVDACDRELKELETGEEQI